jgi:hypothetical protein
LWTGNTAGGEHDAGQQDLKARQQQRLEQLRGEKQSAQQPQQQQQQQHRPSEAHFAEQQLYKLQQAQQQLGSHHLASSQGGLGMLHTTQIHHLQVFKELLGSTESLASKHQVCVLLSCLC